MRRMRKKPEMWKPKLVLKERGIVWTVERFGETRMPEAEARDTARTKAQGKRSHSKEVARKFARLVGEESVRRQGHEYVVCTGGGPGVMEAGCRGARDAGADAIGLGIVLPREEAPNPYVTPELSFNFHYFAVRKMHFLMRARAVAVFPGGFGTLDELFETLTLIQTDRMEPIPVLLFGRDFWHRIVNWEALAEAGTISPEDLELFSFVETAEEGWEIIRQAEGIGG